MSQSINKQNESYTDKLDEDDIMTKLEDYVKVENIAEVSLNTHVRYFLLVTDKKKGTITRKFRLGGFLSKRDPEGKYVILSNGKTTWSVQVESAVFYRKMTITEVKDEYEQDLLKYEKINKKLLEKNKKLKDLLEDLEKVQGAYNKLLNQNERFKKFISKLGYNYKDI
jgi:hypothetical protein